MESSPDTPSPRIRQTLRRRWLIRGLKLGMIVAVAWGVHRTLFAALDQLRDHPWEWRPGWLIVSGLLYLVGLLPAGWFWYWTMRQLGAVPHLGRALEAYYVGHLGKYVPGKAMVVVLRAGMVRGPLVDVRLAAAAVFYETLVTMTACAGLAAFLFATMVDARWEFIVLALGLAAVVAVPTLPPVAEQLIQRLAMRGAAPAVEIRLKWSTMFIGWGASIVTWTVSGLSLEAALVAAGADIGNPLAELPLCAAASALAVVAGFLSLVPGGAVVREAVLLELMTPRYGAAPAVASAILLRLAWLGAELATAGLIYLAILRRRRKAKIAAT